MPLFFLFLSGLLESDTQRIIMGNRDWAQYIAEDLGYYVDFVSVQHATRLMRCGAQTERLTKPVLSNYRDPPQ